jgi:hypothetical protein
MTVIKDRAVRRFAMVIEPERRARSSVAIVFDMFARPSGVDAMNIPWAACYLAVRHHVLPNDL